MNSQICSRSVKRKHGQREAGPGQGIHLRQSNTGEWKLEQKTDLSGDRLQPIWSMNKTPGHFNCPEQGETVWTDKYCVFVLDLTAKSPIWRHLLWYFNLDLNFNLSWTHDTEWASKDSPHSKPIWFPQKYCKRSIGIISRARFICSATVFHTVNTRWQNKQLACEIRSNEADNFCF